MQAHDRRDRGQGRPPHPDVVPARRGADLREPPGDRAARSRADLLARADATGRRAAAGAADDRHQHDADLLRLGLVYGPGILLVEAARWLARRRLLAVWREPTLYQLLSTADFLRAAEAAIVKPDAHGIYHVGDDQPVTVQHFLDELSRVWGCRRPIRLPFPVIYASACLCEALATIARSPSPLTRDIVRLGRVPHWGDTRRARAGIGSGVDSPDAGLGLGNAVRRQFRLAEPECLSADSQITQIFRISRHVHVAQTRRERIGRVSGSHHPQTRPYPWSLCNSICSRSWPPEPRSHGVFKKTINSLCLRDSVAIDLCDLAGRRLSLRPATPVLRAILALRNP